MMTWASGAPRRYEELRERADVVLVGEDKVRVARVDDLIAMKRTTGRPRNERKLLELEELKIVRQQARLAEKRQRAPQRERTERRKPPPTRKPPHRER